jgi:iron complex outermembrane receptor protein
MNRYVKTALLAGAAWSALSTFAVAQDAPAAQSAALDDVIVTARRTEESAQRTPLSLSAFSGESLNQAGATQTTDLQGLVPNLNIVQGRASSNSTNIYIRGVGQPDALQTFDPAVGVYIDDVYYSRIRGTQFDLLDLERVEVLRGPQGTLYGKNTIGGALKLVSRRPGQEFRARGSVAYGSYNMMDVQGSVSGPISDSLALGFSALHSSRDGYVSNPVTGAEYNDKNTNAFRAALAWDPSDNLRVDLIADYSNDDAGLTVGQSQNSLIGSSGQTIVAVTSPPPPWNFQAVVDPTLPNETRLESRGVSLNAAFDLSDALTIRSITGYRRLNTDDYIDFDGTPREVSSALVAVDQDQFSQELQATFESGPITAVGGLYYLQENIDSHQEAYADDLLGPAFLNSTFTRTVDDTLETTSKAAYGNLTWALSDRFRVSGGVRYTEEDKDYDRTTSTFFGALPAFNATFPFLPPVANFTDTSYMASADYQATENVMLYARFSQGFKSGGYNGRANSTAEATQYDPETADSYEVGFKSTLYDSRVRLNVAAFTTDYKNFQARVSGLDIDPITNLPAAKLSVINAGAMAISGLEVDAAWQVTDAFTFDTQIGLLDAEYDVFADARFTATGGSRAFQTPAFAPRLTARYGLTYVAEMPGGGDVTFGGVAKFRSRMALAVDNTATNSQVQLPGMFQDEYWLFDARVVMNDASGRYSLGVYGQNLLNEVYKTDAQEFSSVGQIRTAYFGAPQTIMVKLTARY